MMRIVMLSYKNRPHGVDDAINILKMPERLHKTLLIVICFQKKMSPIILNCPSHLNFKAHRCMA